MLQHDSQRSGLVDGVGPVIPELLFEFETTYWVRSSCLVAPDGSVLIGSYMGGLYCLEPDLRKNTRWQTDLNSDIEGTPCLSPDGIVYVPTMDGRLICIDTNTSADSFVDVKWEYDGPSSMNTSPCLMADGAIVAAFSDGTLQVLERSGNVRWGFSSEGGFEASPAVAHDGTVIAADAQGRVTALSREGSLLWTYDTYSMVLASVTTYFDTVYVISYDGVVHALSLSNGQPDWTFATGCLNIGSSPAVDSAGTLYFGTQEGVLFALWNHGAEKWRFTAAGEIESSPAVDADGKIFFGCSDYCLYCLDNAGDLLWKEARRGKITASPAIGPAEPFIDENGDGICAGNEIYTDVNFNGQWDGNCVYVGSWDRTVMLVGEKTDAVPRLSDGHVSPNSGGVSTVYTYSVGYYSDPGSEPQTTWVVIDGSPFDMSLYREDYYGPGIDEYRYETQLPVGEHTFYFAFKDKDGDAVRLPTDTAFMGPVVGGDNRPPDLLMGHVSPATATLGSAFTFTVDANDPDEDALTAMYLIMKAPGSTKLELYSIVDFYASSKNEGYWTFTYTITLDNVGEYEYIFAGVDEREGVSLLPAEGWYHGPTVTACTSPWPMYRHDRSHTGLSVLEGPYIYRLIWAASAGAGFTSSPCIGESGSLYIGSLDGGLHAYSSDGVPLWTYNTDGMIASSPAVGYQDIVYFGSDDGYVYAVRDGSLVWRTQTGGKVRSSPIMGSSGELYIGSNDGYFYAINKDDGSIAWRYNVGAAINTSPAIYRIKDRDIIYVTANTGSLYAIHNLDVGGVYAMELFHTGHWITSSPCVGPDGAIYFGSNDCNIYAVDPTGTLRWSYPTNSWVRSSPALDKDGNLYVGSLDHNLYCLNEEGELNWKVDLGDQIIASCALDSRGYVFVGTNFTTSDGGKEFCLDRDGNIEWFFQTNEAVNSSTAIGEGNFVYFGSLDWNLYKYGGRDEVAPFILGGGFWNSKVTARNGGILRLIAYVTDPEDNVEYVEMFEMDGDSLDLYLLDNGLGGDEVAGDNIYSIQMNLGPGDMTSGPHYYELIARDGAGNRSELWPYLEIRSEGSLGLKKGIDPLAPFKDAGFREMKPTAIEGSPAVAALGQKHTPPKALAGYPYNADAPVVLEAGFGYTRITTESGGRLQVFARVADAQGLNDIDTVYFQFYHLGVWTGIEMQMDYTQDGMYTLDVNIGPGANPATYLVNVTVTDLESNHGLWPSITVWD
ncbi:MAG: PQQ-binding-like beta-propeller repeat protein [Candidatus Coatesbacteria bacterium]|nr:PQQ-binding-like beta-propeller repeat protein [Candidatus Coatesbacteria bacterium]